MLSFFLLYPEVLPAAVCRMTLVMSSFHVLCFQWSIKRINNFLIDSREILCGLEQHKLINCVVNDPHFKRSKLGGTQLSKIPVQNRQMEKDVWKALIQTKCAQLEKVSEKLWYIRSVHIWKKCLKSFDTDEVCTDGGRCPKSFDTDQVCTAGESAWLYARPFWWFHQVN